MNEIKLRRSPAAEPMSIAAFEAAIRAIGMERYHDKHVFHKLLHGGKLNKGQVQAWALNRYCYQEAVPRKDAALISRAHDRALRREWIRRIHDHDGRGDEPGGIERWLVLTGGLGLAREYVVSRRGALPATRHSAARRRIRARLRQRQRKDARGAGGVRRGGALQMRRALGSARRFEPRLCCARVDSARRIRQQAAEAHSLRGTARMSLNQTIADLHRVFGAVQFVVGDAFVVLRILAHVPVTALATAPRR